MTNQTVAPISGTYPLFDFGAIPGLFPADRNSTYEWVEAFLDPRMMEIWDKYGKPVGLKVIGADMTMSQNMQWSNKRVTKAADFKGLKTRTSGRTQTSTLVALGASPVTLPMAEVEEALRRGTVDAITTAISYGCERGLTALVKYASEWPIHPVFPYVIVVNAKVFDGLDPFFQQALLKAGTEQTYRSAAKGEQMAISYMMWARSVIEVLKPDPGEVDKAMPLMGAVVEEWLKYAGPFGKDVLRISLDYATGPGTKTVRAAISK
jgi:TRAP-type C4-dicarboxylate transport system substrate-binding protein